MAVIDRSPDSSSSICSSADLTFERHVLHPPSPITEVSDGVVSEAGSEDAMTKKLKDLVENHAGTTTAGNRDTIDSILSKYEYATDSEKTSAPRDAEVEHVSADLSSHSHQYSRFRGTYSNYYENSSSAVRLEQKDVALPTSLSNTNSTTTITSSATAPGTLENTRGGTVISIAALGPITSPPESSRQHGPGAYLLDGLPHYELATPTHDDILQQFQKLENLQDEMDSIISEHSTPTRLRPGSRYIASQIPTHPDTSASDNRAKDDETIGSDTTYVEEGEDLDGAAQKGESMKEALDTFVGAVEEDACSKVVLTAALCSIYALVFVSGM